MENNKEKEYFHSLARQLMFDFSDEEIEWIVGEFKTLSTQLALLDKIDTEGVEEMIYPFDVEIEHMREDKVDHLLTRDEVLSNVEEKIEGHFVLPRVVK